MLADALEVRLHGSRIGALTAQGGDQSLFAFDDAYAADEDRPTLSLSFKDQHGRLFREQKKVQTQIEPFFSNLLPEGTLREFLARRANVKPMREYPMLEVLGPDLPGAVTVHPLGNSRADEEGDFEQITTEPAANAPLRFSLAGVQLKFSALADGDRLTVPVSGEGGDWIVKLPSPKFAGVANNEYSMMRLASMTGLDIPDVELRPLHRIQGLPEGIGRFEEEAFVIRRFDRSDDGGLIHIEDFAQVFGVFPQEKYDRGSYRSIAKVLWIETGEEGFTEFIRRVVFNTLIGNGDMHLKNWSLIYPDKRRPKLSPGYDFVSTTTYIASDQSALRYGRYKMMTELSLDEIGYIAAKAGAPEALARKAALEMVDRFHDVWNRERAGLPIPPAVAAEINRLLDAVPIARGR